MFQLIFAAIGFGIISANQSRIVPVSAPYQHPSLKPRQSEFVLQPEPSRHAYRGPTAVRSKINRHNRKRNKA